MASIHREFGVAVPADVAWDAFRDVGAVHTRLARQYVVDTKLEGDSRVVTFANGMVARERIVDVDDARRRLAYAVVESPQLTHHHASFEVVPDGDQKSRIIWITDLLPDSMAEQITAMVDGGCDAIKKTLTR
jgi:polyketide cyclase/dehydrase/lipid transport protein